MKEYDQNQDLHQYKVHENVVNVEQYEVDVKYFHRQYHYIE
jgi:hypothetical protein